LVGFALTCVRDLLFRYLLLSIVCHKPCVLSKFTIHLLNRHLFWSCRLIIPSPWSLGRHKISHFARWYFFLLFSTLPEKNEIYTDLVLWEHLLVSQKRTSWTWEDY
jgi:hypothetical protein